LVYIYLHKTLLKYEYILFLNNLKKNISIFSIYMSFYFGSHINIHGAKDIYENFIKFTTKVIESGGNLVQIFVTNPGNLTTEKIYREKLQQIKKFAQENNVIIIVHSSYLHNLAKEWDEYSWWIKNLELEIEYAYEIGAIGIVIHFGKTKELELSEAYNNMYTSLVYLHSKTLEFKKVKILLETSTGQGTEICHRLEDLSYFYKKFLNAKNIELKDRVKLCVDTCHIFSAGYDIRSKDNIRMYLDAFDELIGIKYIYLIHLNDCRVKLGSNVDRHANIGDGFIGLTGLKYFFRFFKKLKVPIVLETPNYGFLTEIKLLNG